MNVASPITADLTPERALARSRRARRLRRRAGLRALAGALASRALDLSVALTAIALLAPLLVLRGLVAKLRTDRVFDRTPLVGRFRRPLERLTFAGPGPGKRLGVLLNLLRGDLALAGPRPLTEDEARLIPPALTSRFEVRPGLVSPYGIRRRAAVAYEDEATADEEFFHRQSVKGDLGLVARSVPSMLLAGAEVDEYEDELEFFGVRIVNTTMDEAIDWTVESARGAERRQVVFVNPDCLNIAYRHRRYRAALVAATRVLPDGIGIHLGCKIQGTALKANVNGTDLFPRLCERLAKESDLSLFLLGARPGVAETCAENMCRRYPGLRIAGTRDGYFKPEQEAEVFDEIRASGADVLLIAFGAPRQDTWISAHRDELAPAVAIGVGGLFDFYSGRIPRAPVWMREIGLEWTWRLLQEPGRMWRRYVIGNPLFLLRVWRETRTKRRRGGRETER